MSSRLLAWTLAGAAAAAGGALAGCESTQDRSERIRGEGRNRLKQEKGVVVKRQNPDVRILSTASLMDQNGAAVVVRLRNVGGAALAQLPIALDLADSRGRSVYRNDTPGLETSLVSAALLPRGAELWWVNDQVTAATRPTRVKALVGDARRAPGAAPRIVLSGTRIAADPVDGVAVRGVAVNRSRIDQRRLVIYCVARRGGRVVAAGRAIVERLRPNRPTRFTIFFIGDPRRAQLTLAAPPTNLTPERP